MKSSTLFILASTFITNATNIAASCCCPWWKSKTNNAITVANINQSRGITPVRLVPNQIDDHVLPQAEPMLNEVPYVTAIIEEQIQPYEPVRTNSIISQSQHHMTHGYRTAFIMRCFESIHR